MEHSIKGLTSLTFSTSKKGDHNNITSLKDKECLYIKSNISDDNLNERGKFTQPIGVEFGIDRFEKYLEHKNNDKEVIIDNLAKEEKILTGIWGIFQYSVKILRKFLHKCIKIKPFYTKRIRQPNNVRRFNITIRRGDFLVIKKFLKKIGGHIKVLQERAKTNKRIQKLGATNAGSIKTISYNINGINQKN